MEDEEELTPQESGAQGGKERARRLTKEQRADIARAGAVAMWAKKGKEVKPIRRALREAVVRVGNIEFDCAVLEDETRVISERAFSRAIGAKRGGSHWKRMKADPSGARLPVFLSAKNLRPFIPNDLALALSEPISYISGDGQRPNGIDAALTAKILDVWVAADAAGALTKAQKPFAAIAWLLVRALAVTGMVALIDEATGHQQYRDSDALARYLERYIQKEIRQWVRTFPRSFFEMLCMLRDIPFPEDMKLPQYIGHDINNLVWDRLAPGIRRELALLNPAVDGRRKHKHFQFLTTTVGEPRLLHHIGRLEGLGLGFKRGEFDQFKAQVNVKFQTHETLPLWKDKPDAPRRAKATSSARLALSAGDAPSD